jgi:hypothetical protein
MKKVVSIIISAALIFALLTGATIAAEPEQDEYSIRANQIEQMLQDSDFVSASFTDNNGKEIPLAVTFSVRAVPTFRLYDSIGEHEYVITATAKTTSNSNSNSSIRITLNMHWTDVLGPKNILRELSGSYSLSSGSVNGSSIQWGQSVQDSYSGYRDIGTVSNFRESINFTSGSLVGTLRARYNVFHSSGTIRVVVMPTVFD